MELPLIGALLLIVPGLVIFVIFKSKQQPGQSFKDVIGLNPFTIFAILVTVSSFMASTLVPDSHATWRVVLEQRIACQLSGPFLLALAVLKEAFDSTKGRGFERAISGRAWMLSGAIFAVGLFYCINPMLDLIQGPVQMKGTLTPNVYTQTGGRSSYLVWGFRLETADGTVYWLTPGNLHLRELRALFTGYPHGRKAHLAVLRHVGAALDCNNIQWE